MNCERSARDYLSENGWRRTDLLDRLEARRLLRASGGDWYVYVLWSSVGATLLPFYVGMGRRFRALRHQNPCSRAENPIKKAAWERCLAADGAILHSFPASGLSIDQARQSERQLIAAIGRRMTGSGPLANLTEGGEGVIGVVHRKGGASPKAKPIIVDGRRFPSIHEAVAELKINKGELYT